MPLTLKGTGLATNLKMCLAVDDDGTTIKEFVSSDVNTNKTLGTGVAAGIGAATWKGTSRGYFPTFADGPFDYFGIRFPAAHQPLFNADSGRPFSFFAAMRAMGAGANARALVEGPTSGTYLFSRPLLGGPLSDSQWGGGSASTNMPSDLGAGDTGRRWRRPPRRRRECLPTRRHAAADLAADDQQVVTGE
jgi:hypothetical protein